MASHYKSTAKMAAHHLMLESLAMAEHALLQREVPVGCIVVDRQGSIVARGCNEVNATKNATRHAEMVVIDQLLQLSKQKGVDLKDMCSGHTLYVTVEPCVMCTYALRLVGLTKVTFGCSNIRFGGCGSVVQAATMELHPPSTQGPASEEVGEGQDRSPLPPLEITSGVMKDEAIALLQRFYEEENPLAPEEKVKRKTKKQTQCEQNN